MTPPAHPPTRHGPNATSTRQLHHTTTPACMARPMWNPQNTLRTDDSALRGFADFGRGFPFPGAQQVWPVWHSGTMSGFKGGMYLFPPYEQPFSQAPPFANAAFCCFTNRWGPSPSDPPFPDGVELPNPATDGIESSNRGTGPQLMWVLRDLIAGEGSFATRVGTPLNWGRSGQDLFRLYGGTE